MRIGVPKEIKDQEFRVGLTPSSAKALLERKGVEYTEFLIEGNRELMREMIERSQRRTVPQIFIDELHVGGYDDLAVLEARGELDALLGQ